MPDAPTLESLAHAHFGNQPFTEAETKLVRLAADGGFAICGPNNMWDDPANAPMNADKWGPNRQIGAELIRWLCVNREARDLIDPLGITVMGARIIGELNFLYVTVPFPLSFLRCRFEGQIDLNNANFPALDFSGSTVDFLKADGAIIKGGVLLRQGFCALGGVRMVGTEIGTTLDLSSATLKSNPNTGNSEQGVALRWDRLSVKASVYMDKKFSAEGAVFFLGAQIGGDLQCQDCQFENPFQQGALNNGIALSASNLRVGGNVWLRDGFRCTGQVQFPNARIGGELGCVNATFAHPFQPRLPSSGIALAANGLVVDRSVYLGSQFQGGIQLTGSRIGGSLIFNAGSVENTAIQGADLTGQAVIADDAVIAGTVILRPDFHALGRVSFLQSQIGRDLTCDGASISNPRLLGAPEPAGYALSADELTVTGSVFLRYGFHAEGDVRLPGAQIGGSVFCVASTFNGTVNLEGSSIKGRLFWNGIIDPELAALVLSSASAADLFDEAPSWPRHGNLFLDGFVYQRFSGGPTDAESRLDWLDRMSQFAPQPYKQLANILKSAGDENGATTVLVEMEYRQRAKGEFAKALSSAHKLLNGYGYYPTKGAVLGLVAVWGIGWVIFRRAELVGTMAPTEKEAYNSLETNGSLPNNYPPFSAWIYSLDNTLPLARLGQRDKWNPDPNPQSIAIRRGIWTGHLRHLKKRWFVLHPFLLLRTFLRLVVRRIIWIRHRIDDPKLLRLTWSARCSLRGLMGWSLRISFLGTSPKLQRYTFCAQVVLGWILATLLAASIAAMFIRKL